MQPRVSVIMPVYNGEKYLAEAIESILNQTLTDFEFVIIDDASQDSSLIIAREFARRDERIQIVENAENLGISVSLNKSIAITRCKYIARMDADDISLPERLDVQVAFMDAYPEVGICGTWIQYIGQQNKTLKLPVEHDAIFARLLFENVLAHPTVMMRVASIREQALHYDEEVRFAQDYEFWSRAINRVKLANINRILLYYRIHSQGVGSRYGQEQHEIHALIYRRLLKKLGLDFTNEDIRLHHRLSTHQYGNDINLLRRTQDWLAMISVSNKASQMIPPAIMDAELGEVWARVCRQSPLHPVRIFIYILSHPFRFHSGTGLREVLKRFASLL
ncbi:MAG: glycosyltransferase [Chloroflexi bacterium]|nr:glycosyltransferase [Chloroflexota bacterium]